MFNSLRPHEPQNARPPCPSPTPGAYPNSCPLSQWCHPTISSSVVPFNFSQHQGLFKWGSSSHEVAEVLEFQLQHQSYQWTPRTDLLGLVGSSCSPRDSQESSPTRAMLYLDSYSNVNACWISLLNWLGSVSDLGWMPASLLLKSLQAYKVLEIKVLSFFELQFSSYIKWRW